MSGIRYRAGRSAVVALLAAVAVAAAVLAPGFARAAQQSVLTDRLAAAPAPAAGLTVAASGTATGAPAAHQGSDQARAAVDAALAAHPALARALDRPVGGADTEAVISGTGQGDLAARLAYRDGVCGQLDVTGECPDAAGEVLVSERTAAAYGIAPGDRVDVRLAETSLAATVVGAYTPVDPSAPYWGRTVYFTHGGFDPATGAPRVDALFAGADSDVRADPAAAVTLAVTYPLRPGAVRLDDLTALRADLRDLATVGGLRVETDLPAILDEVAADRAAIGRAAPVIAVPLLLLVWFVLFLVVASLTEERGPELALAKLRGFPSGQVARFGLAGVLALIVAAAPAGVAIGLGVVEVAAAAVLADGVHASLRWPVVAAAAAAVAAAGLAALVAARSTLRRDPLQLLRRVPGRTPARAGLVEGALVALAAASLVVALGDPTAPLALLAPALVAVVAGVATARLVRLWSARRLRRLRRGRTGIPGLLTAAQLARRPGGQRVVAVVTVAVALLSFGALAWDTAAQARRDHATDAVGADRVYRVHADHPAALVEAVHAADPDGTAMAVVRAAGQYAGEPVELLAVESGRLAGVAAWRGVDATGFASALRPAEPAPLAIGDSVEVDAEVRELGPEPVRLTALVSAPGEPPRPVPLGTLARGRDRYAASVPECAAGCRLLGLGLGRTGATGPFTATVAVTSIRSRDGELPARFDDPGAWQTAGEASLTGGAGPGDAALTVAVAGGGAGDVVVEYRDSAGEAVPVVLAGPAPASDPAATGFEFPGFTERPEPFTVVGHADRLPRAGERGLLFDLESAVSRAERSVALADSDGLRYEVWAAPAAPADLPRRLAEHGIPVLRTESIAAELDRLGRQAPALALWLYLLAAAAAVALAIVVVVLATRTGAETRRDELAALRACGVPARLLTRAAAREYAALLGWPLLVGVAVGVATAMLMLPGIPLVEAGTGGGAAAPGWPGTLLVAVGASAAGLALAAVPGLRLGHRAGADRLPRGAAG